MIYVLSISIDLRLLLGGQSHSDFTHGLTEDVRVTDVLSGSSTLSLVLRVHSSGYLLGLMEAGLRHYRVHLRWWRHVFRDSGTAKYQALLW